MGGKDIDLKIGDNFKFTDPNGEEKLKTAETFLSSWYISQSLYQTVF